MIRRAMTLLLAGSAAPVCAQDAESDYYTLEQYAPPEGEVVEVGGIAFLDETTMLVSTRRGRVWKIENALADDPKDARWSIFVEGLEEGLGITVVDDRIYVIQRGELSRLIDHDGDGVCDEVETVTQDWGRTNNYHEFTFGLPRDLEGNFYVGLNVGFWSPEWWHGSSRAPYRGWILQITPEGAVTPFASGVRSPCGLGVNSAGDIFYTDNQGDWMATCPIFHVQKGAYFGHPASRRWTPEFGMGEKVPSTTEPLEVERAPAAMWLPYAWSRSAGNLVEDRSDGAFGPFAGQMFLAELTNGMVIRTQFEKVRGEYQGAAFLFRQKLGSVCRVEFAPDHSLIVGYTNRGWGGRGPSHGLGRLRFTGKAAFEMQSVALQQDGFLVNFTEPVADDVDTAAIEAELYHYNYWWDYGSPIQGRTPVKVTAAERSADGKQLRLRIAGMEPARCIGIKLPGLRSAAGRPLLHDEFHYTINQLPEGPLTTERVNRIVEPPSVRTGDSEGWLHLTWGDALGMFDQRGWELCDVDLDETDPTKLVTRPGIGALVNSGDSPTHFRSKVELRDYEFFFRFMLPDKGDSGMYLMQRYELQINDDPNGLGGVINTKKPRNGKRAYQGHGIWHKLTGRFRAPRFDGSGKRTQKARVEGVALDGVEVVPLAELEGPTPGGEKGEVSWAPFFFQSTGRKVCLGDIRVKSLDDASLRDAAISEEQDLLTDAQLTGWSQRGAAKWNWSDGVLRASGGAGRLVSELDTWRDFELRLRLQVNDGGDAGLRFRFDGEKGYEAEINCTGGAATNTGSLVGFRDIQTDLVPGGTKFDYVVRCRDVDAGTEVRIFLNGVEVASVVDAEKRFDGGRIALEVGPGTELRVERLMARRL